MLTHSCRLLLALITYNLSRSETKGFRRVFNRQNWVSGFIYAKKMVPKSSKRKQNTVISSSAMVLKLSTNLREKCKAEPNSVTLWCSFYKWCHYCCFPQKWQKYTTQPGQLCSNNNQTLLGAAGFADAFNFCTSKYTPGPAPLVCTPTKDWISVNSRHFCHHQNTQKSTFPWKRGRAESEVGAGADRPCPREVPRTGKEEPKAGASVET